MWIILLVCGLITVRLILAGIINEKSYQEMYSNSGIRYRLDSPEFIRGKKIFHSLDVFTFILSPKMWHIWTYKQFVNWALHNDN